MIPDFVEEDLTALKKQIKPYTEDGCSPNGIPIEDLAPVHVVDRLLRRIEYLEAAINNERMK